MPYNVPADLIRYLPPYYEENEEIIRLTNAENPEIDRLWDAVQAVQDNQFIETADDRRIRQWERLLRIRPDYATQSLDYRKAVVLMRLSTRIPLTYRWLLETAADSAGEYGTDIRLDHDAYCLYMRFVGGRPAIADEFYRHIRKTIPANLWIGFQYERNLSANIYIGAVVRHQRVRTWVCPKTPRVDHCEWYAGCVVRHTRKRIYIESGRELG